VARAAVVMGSVVAGVVAVVVGGSVVERVVLVRVVEVTGRVAGVVGTGVVVGAGVVVDVLQPTPSWAQQYLRCSSPQGGSLPTGPGKQSNAPGTRYGTGFGLFRSCRRRFASSCSRSSSSSRLPSAASSASDRQPRPLLTQQYRRRETDQDVGWPSWQSYGAVVVVVGGS